MHRQLFRRHYDGDAKVGIMAGLRSPTLIIQSIELREIRLPLIHFFETSFGRTTERRVVLARVIDRDGAEGWGECTAGEGPFYSEEWTETAWPTLKDFLAPMVVGHEVQNAGAVSDLMKKVRGHRMAKGALETACWDLDIVRRVRERFPEIGLMGDANSAYTLADASLFRALDEFKLMMIEQPLRHDDIFDHAELQKQIKTPVCLDESVKTPEDARHAIALGACGVINVKLGRVGGHAQAKKVENIAREQKIPVWCGGMLESGIGRAHNIAMATLEGFTLPGDVSASARCWEEDIIEPPVTVSASGTITAPTKSGIGFDVNRAQVDSLTMRCERITR